MNYRKLHKLYYMAPYLLGVVLLIIFISLKLFFKIDYLNLKGLKDVLNSFIIFVSIVIGFYLVFCGIIISVNKSKFFVTLQKSRYKDVLPKQLYYSLIFSFLALVLTTTLQILMNYAFWLSYIIYFAWSFVIGVFVTYTFLNYILAISITFYSEPVEKEVEQIEQI